MAENDNFEKGRDLLTIKVGENIRGMEVCQIYSQNSKYVIFAHRQGIGYITRGIDRSKIQEHYAEFNRINGDIILWIPEIQRPVIYQELAFILKRMYDQCDAPPALDIFAEVARTVKHYGLTKAREIYLLGALGGTALISACTLAAMKFNPDQPVIYSGIWCGTAGAFLSVLIRASKISLDTRHTKRSHALQGCLKVLLGSIFGPVTLFAIKAEVILSFAKDNDLLRLLFAFVSGFSERFVPELLDSLEGSARKETK